MFAGVCQGLGPISNKESFSGEQQNVLDTGGFFIIRRFVTISRIQCFPVLRKLPI